MSATATALGRTPDLSHLPASRPLVRGAVRIGLIGGVIGVYLGITGIVERFDARFIIADVITLGYLLLFIVPLLSGNWASRVPADQPRPPPGARVLSGALAGVVATGLVLVFDALFQAWGSTADQPRDVFINASPTLLDDILLFGQGLVVGGLILVVGGVLLGALGAGLHLVRERERKVIVTGLLVLTLVSLAQPLVVPMMLGLFDRIRLLIFDPEWLYTNNGMTLPGAAATLGAAVAIRFLQLERGEQIRHRVDALPDERRKTLKAVTFGIITGLVILFPFIAGKFVTDVMGTVGLYVLLGLGLNIVVGYAGLLDLGYVAFFAVGAYAVGVLTSAASFLVTSEDTPLAELGFTNFWIALPLVVIIAVIIGVAIGAPVLRLRGDYLAIVTLGFGEIIRTLVISDWLKPYLGGAQGMIRIGAPPPEALDLRDPIKLYFLILAFCLLAAFISHRLSYSRVGRAWIAMREDEQVAEAMGVSVVKYKLLAFAMGAAVACLGGAFFAAKIGSIFPNSFGLIVSINVLAVIILGGMGSIPGVLVGAFVLVGLPELLREFAEYRLLLYGAILMAIMILKPEGLLPSKRRQLELHEEQILEEQFAHRTGGETPAPIITAKTES